MYHVYILRCSDGAFYVGQSQDLAKRLQVHQSGKGPAFTAVRLPVELVYQESCTTLEESVRRERQLKGWSRSKKHALIAGNDQMLKKLVLSRI